MNTTAQLSLLPSKDELTPITMVSKDSQETLVSSSPRNHLLPAMFAHVHQYRTKGKTKLVVQIETWHKAGSAHEGIIIEKLRASILAKIKRVFRNCDMTIQEASAK